MRNTKLAILIAALVLAPQAAAYYLGFSYVPVDRLLPRLEERVAKTPDDAHGRYLLGRVHGAAFGLRSAEIRMHGSSDELKLDSREPQTGDGAVAARGLQWTRSDSKKIADEAVLRKHLTEALRQLSRAVELSPQDALYRNGLACALDEGSAFAPSIDSSVISAAVLGSLSPTETEQTEKDLELLK